MNQGGRSSVGSFIDDVPKGKWACYGDHSVALCNGHGLIILPGAFQPDGFDAMREQLMSKRLASDVPDWKKIMASCKTAPALITVTLCGRRVVLPGENQGSAATSFFKPLESSPFRDWIPLSSAYVGFFDNWGGAFARPQPATTKNGSNPVPFMGRDKKNRIVLWGALMPQRVSDLKQDEMHNLKQMRKHGRSAA